MFVNWKCWIIWRLSGAGAHLGLSVILDAQVANYHCSSTRSIGFKVYFLKILVKRFTWFNGFPAGYFSKSHWNPQNGRFWIPDQSRLWNACYNRALSSRSHRDLKGCGDSKKTMLLFQRTPFTVLPVSRNLASNLLGECTYFYKLLIRIQTFFVIAGDSFLLS